MTEERKAAFREQLGRLVDEKIRGDLRERGVDEALFDKLVEEDLVFKSICLTGPIEKLVGAPDTVLIRCGG